MPKRVIDFDAMWSSDKIAACAEWAQTEYAWLYGVADANGSFELSNLKVIWGKAAAIRKNLSLARLEQIINEFRDKGLLFVWSENGKRYGHWTGSDKPGRLPRGSRRTPRYGPIFAPPVPKGELKAFEASFCHGCDTRPVAVRQECVDGLGLGLGLGLGNGNGSRASHAPTSAPSAPGVCERLAAVWNAERGTLPAIREVTRSRREKILARVRTDEKFEERFSEAARKARTTPFLIGSGDRGWRANFDWFIANDTNIVGVLEGKYDSKPNGKGGDPDARDHDNSVTAGLLPN